MAFPLIYLRDTNPNLVECWKHYFKEDLNVSISQGDIFDIEANAIVSPANGFGRMDGGIDAVYIKKFGVQLEEQVKALIAPMGELPVGSALYLHVQNGLYLIVAPTMRHPPFNLDNTLNPYYSFRAALLKAKELAAMAGIESIICPGMGTGSGQACVDMTARQMYAAYHNVVFGYPTEFGEIMGQQQWMMSCTASEEKAKADNLKETEQKTDATNPNP